MSRSSEFSIVSLRGFTNPPEMYVNDWAELMARKIVAAQSIAFRQSMGLNQRDFARQHGIQPMTLSQVERLQHVNIEGLLSIARAFDKVLLVKMVDVADLDEEAVSWEGDYDTRGGVNQKDRFSA